ncbi:MAG: ATP-binding protein, partial [Calditrichaceae bacterium]
MHNNESYLVKGISSGYANEIRNLDYLNESAVFLESRELFIIRISPGKDQVVYAGFGSSQMQKILKSFNNESDHTIILRKSGLIISAGSVDKITEAEQKESVSKKPKDSFDEIFYDPPYIQQESRIGNDWTVRSTKFASGFYKELRKFLIEIIVANILIGILMLASALFLARRVTTPIRSLVSAVHKISKGDLKRPIRIESKDEIKILADEFELMRQKLLESYTNLEIKIEERTKALKEAQFQISHQEKMASLGLMAAGIAHEIGNPLTGISSMAQIIKRKSTDPKLIEYLDTILKNTERISKIVRELVDIAKPSSYEAGIVNLNDIIHNAAEFVKYDRRSKNVNLELELDPELPELHLVADQLLQVFINVLINAVDALTEQNDKIIIRSFLNGNDVKVQFEDNGVGIPDEHLKKIFEPFFTTKEVGKGTGLGLSVSYGIIKNFNGRIDVKSTPGKGS